MWQLLIGIQLLTGISHHFFRYNTTIVDWDSIKNSIDAPDVTFACLATANFHYGLFGERVEGLSLLPISNIPEIPIVDTHYGQYSELVADPPISDRDCYNKNTVDTNENDDGGVGDDRVADNNDHQGEGNN